MFRADPFLYLHLPSYSSSVTFPRPRLLLVVPFERLLGDNYYKESSPALTRVLELSLEGVRGPDMIVIKRDLLLRFLDARLLESSPPELFGS